MVLAQENAREVATELGLDTSAEDPRSRLRLSAERMGIDNLHVSRGFDALRVELEDESRRRTGDRTTLFRSHGVFPPKVIDDPGGTYGLLDAPEVQIQGPDGKVLGLLPITMLDGTTASLQDVVKLPAVVYVTSDYSVATSNVPESVDSLNRVAETGCSVVFFSVGTQEGLVKQIDSVSLDPAILVARLNGACPPDWGPFLGSPSLVLVSEDGSLKTGSPQGLFREVLIELSTSASRK